jgi:DNA-binding NtrC family response regulator
MTERGLATLERARGGTLVLCNIDKLSTDSMQALCGWLDELAARGTTDTWVVGTTRPERIPDGKGRGRGEQEAWWELATRLGTPVILPSITERADQLPLLIETLVAEACRPDGRPLPRVPQAFVDACRAHHWPENIAELRRVVLAAVELARRGVLSLAPLPGGRPDAVRPYRQAAEGFDRAVLTQALQASEGNVPHAARLLGLPESTFRYKARKLELDTRDFEPKATDASD